VKTFLAAIDCGTTVVKGAVVGLHGEIKGFAGIPSPCVRYPDGRIESDPRRLANACFASLRGALAASGISPKHVEGLALSNQRATFLCLDAGGRALGNAISWQDRRGAARIQALPRCIPDERYGVEA
jgi:sugar (pentulose or hexulose) kinase